MSEAVSETVPTPTSQATRVTVRVLGKYLCGDREAIYTIASAPAALGLGLLSVVRGQRSDVAGAREPVEHWLRDSARSRIDLARREVIDHACRRSNP